MLSIIGVNRVQLIGIYDGRVIVLVYNWVVFLEQYFVRVLNINQYYYFRFFKDEFGKVYFKELNSFVE